MKQEEGLCIVREECAVNGGVLAKSSAPKMSKKTGEGKKEGRREEGKRRKAKEKRKGNHKTQDSPWTASRCAFHGLGPPTVVTASVGSGRLSSMWLRPS